MTGTGSGTSFAARLPQPPDALPRYVLGLDIGGTKLAAGIVDPTGTALAEIAERGLGRPAFIKNDATAAASAEHRHGAGVGARNLVYLTVSTGVGGGCRLLRLRAGSGAAR